MAQNPLPACTTRALLIPTGGAYIAVNVCAPIFEAGFRSLLMVALVIEVESFATFFYGCGETLPGG